MRTKIKNIDIAQVAIKNLSVERFFIMLCMILSSYSSFSQDYKSEKKLIKGANELFENKEYEAAIPLFSTLVSNYPKDPTYNYKYGVCLFYGSADKWAPNKYLKYAISKPDVAPIVLFYYAENLHLNYEFNEAIKYYKKYLSIANDIKPDRKRSINNQIKQCENAKELLKNITDLIVQDQIQANDNDYYKTYDLTDQGGRFFPKIDDFRTPYEIKNDLNNIFYFPKDAKKIFFSSHTDLDKDGTDIFYAIRNDDGTWSKPINLGKTINTKFNENSPYMSPDGVTLYFASEGHNSIGGYDVFTSILDTNTGAWSIPRNLDFAINTPANDYLFIPTRSQESAYFTSDRKTPKGEVIVYHINMVRLPLGLTYIIGNFSSESTKNATIKVQKFDNDSLIGEIKTDENGDYKIKVSTKEKYRILVDYEGGAVTHSGEVDLAKIKSSRPLRQEMTVSGEGSELEKLTIKNFVEEETDEMPFNPVFIREKSKLTVNKDEYKNYESAEALPVVPKKVNTGPTLSVLDEKEVTKDSEANETLEAESTQKENENDIVETNNDIIEDDNDIIGNNETQQNGLSTLSTNQSNNSKLLDATSTSDQINTVIKENIVMTETSKNLLTMQEAAASFVSDAKNKEVSKLRDEANELLSNLSLDSEDDLNSEKYKSAQQKKDKANQLMLQSEIAQETATLINKSETEFSNKLEVGLETKNKINNDENRDNYLLANDFNNQITKTANESMDIYTRRNEAFEKYQSKSIEIKQNSIERSDLDGKISELEERMIQEMNELETASGKNEIEALQSKIDKDNTDALALKEKRDVLMTTQKELSISAQKDKATYEVLDEIISNYETKQGYNTLSSKPNLIGGEGLVKGLDGLSNNENKIRPTNDEIAAKELADENVSEDISGENETINNTNLLVKAKVPNQFKNISTTIPENNYRVIEKESFDENKKRIVQELSPEDGKVVTAFIPENSLAELAKENQSISNQISSNYQLAYKKEYERIVQKQNKYQKAVATYVLTQSWIMDIDKELSYLEGIKSEIPNTYLNKLEERQKQLKSHKLTKLNDLSESLYRIEKLDKKETESITLIASNYRKELNQELDAMGRENSRELNQELVAETTETENETNDIDLEKSQAETFDTNGNEKSTESNQELVAETTETENETNDIDLEKSQAETFDTNGNEKSTELNQELVAETTETEKETGDVDLEKSQVEAIVTEYYSEVENRKNNINAEIEDELAEIEGKKTEMETVNKKVKKIIATEIKLHENRIVFLEKETQLLKTSKATVASVADNALAMTPDEVRPSEIQLRKSRSKLLESEDVRELAAQKSAEKVRGKKKKAVKLMEVDALNSEVEELKFEAESFERLAKTLAKIEDEALHANSHLTLAELPKSSRKITEAEIQEIKNTKEYQAYDVTHNQAVVKYNNIQHLKERKVELEKQKKIVDAEMLNINNQLINESDTDNKKQLYDNLQISETKNAEIVNELIKVDAEIKENKAEYIKLHNKSVNEIIAVEGEKGELLIAMANLANEQGHYATEYNEPDPASSGTSETGYSPDKFSRVVQGVDNYPERLSDAIFDMVDFNKSLYNEDNPMPIDVKIPNGLVYKVQIGAFRNPPAQDIYKGFAPIMGENTRPGWIRYTAGLFNVRSQAQLKRNEIKALGYTDAFVVAYLNGKRISLSRAKDIETGEEEVPKVISKSISDGDIASNEQPKGSSGEVKQLSEIKGLMYTVQVGAFRAPVTSNELYGITPLIEYKIGSLYKYGSGVYNDLKKAKEGNAKVRELGVSDAFVTAFYNGKRITMDEAKRLSNSGSDFANEQPVTVAKSLNPNNAGIKFRIQLGAYREEVPVEDAKIILGLSNLGLDVKVEGDLTLYTAGNYESYAEAKQMQTKIVNEGLNGAFVVALKNGEKIDVQQAIKLSTQ